MSSDGLFTIVQVAFWLYWANECYRRKTNKSARWSGVMGCSFMALAGALFTFGDTLPSVFLPISFVLLAVALVLLVVSYRYSLVKNLF